MSLVRLRMVARCIPADQNGDERGSASVNFHKCTGLPSPQLAEYHNDAVHTETDAREQRNEKHGAASIFATYRLNRPDS